MPDNIQKPLLIPHHNHGLFADYYLNEIVPTLPEWNLVGASGPDAPTDMVDGHVGAQHVAPVPAAPVPAAPLQQIKTLRASINPAALDESQLEQQWIQPVLRILGHHYAVQPKIRYRDAGNRRPDYAFLATEAEARAVTNQIYEPKDITHWLAVGDAKIWGAKLDQSAPGQRNPSQQIDEYLRYSERPWGILTDGRWWRLYHRDSSKHNAYYAVDLESLLEADDPDAFRYFYAFFRREAFTDQWLEKVLAGSEDFAQKLSDKLEEEVYDALELIAQGYLDYRRNRLTADAATLRQIYEQSLVLLYRMLFIFYAESREILPLDNPDYRSRLSMDSIKKKIAQDTHFNKTFDADSSSYYAHLSDLFFAIDAGNDFYGVPAYNGRLFSDAEHPFLAKNHIGDLHLAPALDKLARVDQNGKRVFVDYRDLEVRHLGSIYEKLLEYELKLATDADHPEDKAPGQVYLQTGSGERKVTGSYYTPDYIVRFIVEKTLEPLLTAITQRHAAPAEDGTWIVNNPTALVNDILALNVLDPATGSGHFVVDATAYIAEWLRGLGIRPPDLGENEDELIYWKRQVASACIYAVDINPLAVELAKLSMWLATLAKGKPLSFLDHHIRLGNSLVGTRISTIDDNDVSVRDEERRRRARQRRKQQAAEVGQIALFSDADFSDGLRYAVQHMSAIENTVANTVSDVKTQEKLYAELTQRLSSWKQAADVWTARYFGLDISMDEWKTVRKLTQSGLISPAVQKTVDQAAALAGQHRFFHWELAFPEIFYDADGQPKAEPGFDAVIGNPPYVRMERLKDQKSYFSSAFETYQGSADLYVYFFERGFQLLRTQRRQSYVTSGSWLYAKYATPLRSYIKQRIMLESLIDLGDTQTFKGALDVYPAISVIYKTIPPEKNYNALVATFTRADRVSLDNDTLNNKWINVGIDDQLDDGWQLDSIEIRQLTQKLTITDKQLKDIAGGRMYRGILTGYNDAFIINEATYTDLINQDKRNEKILRPIISGAEVRPWYSIDSKNFLVWSYQGINIDEYPAIKQHLEKHREALSNRWEPSRGQCEWYELRPCSYYDEFDKPKIFYPEMAKYPRFSLAPSGLVSNKTAFMIGSNSFSLLGILQSRALWFVISKICQPIGERAGSMRYMLSSQNVERLPIPELTAEQESKLAGYAEEITTVARARYQLHEDMRTTIRNEFGGGDISTRVALYRWWDFADEQALSDEIRRQFGDEIPLKKRSEWRHFLAEQKATHVVLTERIKRSEKHLNGIVYDAFGLTPEERDLIERTTKYPYGEV